MPKLLNVNSYHYRRGGSDAVYFDHAALLASQGWDSGFFSMQHPKNEATPWSRYFIDELEFGHSYSLRQKLAMAAKVVYSFEAQRKLRVLLQDFPADVAHLHCIYHHLSPSILPVLREAGVPVVLTAHDLKIACPAYKMLNAGGVCERCKTGSVLNVIKHRCVRDSLGASAIVAVESGLHGLRGPLDSYRRHVSRVVAPSRFYVEKLVEWGWPREQLCYIPNYVDAAAFEPQYEPGDYLLYFGRLAPEKGLATLLRAAAQAGVALKLAGTGPEDEALRRLAAELGVDARFLGFQSGAALHALIRGARAVVLPSEWYENAPMSVLESFAFGKPVLGAQIGGIPEMIEAGLSGWTFASGDVAALAERLREIRATPDSRIAEMGRAARAAGVQRFHRAGYLQQMLALYAELGVRI
ncbi:glycosyltransferase family 4 protein [Roseateles sp.]|uniref:glycosyltransferase family 4 protein n=1 Tax=Roseateles sp. TaxID=1971397 RepID=UPI0037C8C84E